jgi:hypothetical protein
MCVLDFSAGFIDSRYIVLKSKAFVLGTSVNSEKQGHFLTFFASGVAMNCVLQLLPLNLDRGA